MGNQITVEARKVAEMIGRVSPMMGKDAAHPALNTLRLVARGGSLYVTATDRYIVAVDAVEVATGFEADEFEALVPADQVAGLVRALKTSGHAGLSKDGDVLTVDVGATRLSITDRQEAYPVRVVKIVAESARVAERHESSRVSLSIRQLAQIAKAIPARAGGRGQMVFHFGKDERSPLIVTSPEHLRWIVAVMPVLSDEQAMPTTADELV